MLKKYIDHIEHQSALQILCQLEQQQQKNNNILIPPEISSVIKVQPGDCIALVGKSASGKTYILSQLVKYSIDQQYHVLYIDLAQQYGSTFSSNTIQNDYIHIFQPSTNIELLGIIHGLEKWFYNQNNKILWVMVDGEWQTTLKQQLLDKIKILQHYWSFALVYTSRTFLLDTHDYQFECYKQEQNIRMKLV
ncbi:uncharacterized protein BX664DRAFT_344116 [Halteromyces radiatus]|uniref:uncharacterized protein n=1 Tax=Halteromyces radiatus TaxID=101107 RepID=UPI00221FA5F7|nr:uncharacterized protein BX664DRAFT_344116 [Halteromyces radiatus]KAI8076859.1 hypothetical protein BX664DRAFT_344116 [Halteromyces radiatus]